MGSTRNQTAAIRPDAMDWSAGNRDRIERLCERARELAASAEKMLAVFDFAGTLIVNDLGDKIYHHQAENLDFKFDDPGFLSAVQFKDYGAKVMAARDRVIKGGEPATLFRDQCLTLYLAMLEDKGPMMAYPFVTRLLSGFTEQEVRDMADRVIEEQEAATISREELVLPEGRRLDFRQGIRLSRPVAGLMTRLKAEGALVCVISGTSEIVVDRFLKRHGLEVDVLIGMKTHIVDGKLTDRIVRPPTISEGKLEIVMNRFGRLPDFAAGDSPFDVPLLRAAGRNVLLVDQSQGMFRDQEVLDEAASRGWMVQVFGQGG